MRRPISFLATSNEASSRAFYSHVMGLKLVEETEYSLVFDDGGTMLRVQKVQSFEPAFYTCHGWQVDDIDESIQELSAKGVEFSSYPRLNQSATGVWVSPSGDKVAWFKDPCGNNLSLTEFGADDL